MLSLTNKTFDMIRLIWSQLSTYFRSMLLQGNRNNAKYELSLKNKKQTTIKTTFGNWKNWSLPGRFDKVVLRRKSRQRDFKLQYYPFFACTDTDHALSTLHFSVAGSN